MRAPKWTAVRPVAGGAATAFITRAEPYAWAARLAGRGDPPPRLAAEMTAHSASIASSLLICGLSLSSRFSNEL